jgi:arylformamidase
MRAIIEHRQKKIAVRLDAPIDISIPMFSGAHNPNAFGIQAPEFKPFEVEGFVGSVERGGSVNCENLFFNPHGNGTHTECVGHISRERITINRSLTQFMFMAQVVTVTPEDNCIWAKQIEAQLSTEVEALIIRTLPNTEGKRLNNYSGNNPAHLDPALCALLAEKGIKHLLVDLPSVDPEHDNGTLTAHHAFWQYPANTRLDATITEMVYVPETVVDGTYLLNIQIASLETDASPSKPVLYTILPDTNE